MLFQQLKHDNLEFRQATFEKLYGNAQDSAKVLLSKIRALREIKREHLQRLDEFMGFKLFEAGESHWYIVGFHIIYSIIYLQREELITEITGLLDRFKSHFGKLHSKQIISLYENLMRDNGMEPILSFQTSGGYINLREVEDVWRTIFKDRAG
jgi:hypothetical protein